MFWNHTMVPTKTIIWNMLAVGLRVSTRGGPGTHSGQTGHVRVMSLIFLSFCVLLEGHGWGTIPPVWTPCPQRPCVILRPVKLLLPSEQFLWGAGGLSR